MPGGSGCRSIGSSTMPFEAQLAWGQIRIRDRLNVSNEYLTFGGAVTAGRDDGTTVVAFVSPAPLLRRGGHSQGWDFGRQSVGAFFARLAAEAGSDRSFEMAAARAGPGHPVRSVHRRPDQAATELAGSGPGSGRLADADRRSGAIATRRSVPLGSRGAARHGPRLLGSRLTTGATEGSFVGSQTSWCGSARPRPSSSRERAFTGRETGLHIGSAAAGAVSAPSAHH